jgi:hypothetical protein
MEREGVIRMVRRFALEEVEAAREAAAAREPLRRAVVTTETP